MKKGLFRFVLSIGIVCWVLWFARAAEATQVHTEPEGLYAHQMAHAFFMFSMGFFIYWLRARKWVQEAGWRLVQYAAFFFILWNLDALLVHYLDGREDLFEIINAGSWRAVLHLSGSSDGPAILYYFIKLDHLLCVPAIIFLYAGLRRLSDQAGKSRLSERQQ